MHSQCRVLSTDFWWAHIVNMANTHMHTHRLVIVGTIIEAMTFFFSLQKYDNDVYLKMLCFAPCFSRFFFLSCYNSGFRCVNWICHLLYGSCLQQAIFSWKSILFIIRANVYNCSYSLNSNETVTRNQTTLIKKNVADFFSVVVYILNQRKQMNQPCIPSRKITHHQFGFLWVKVHGILVFLFFV